MSPRWQSPAGDMRQHKTPGEELGELLLGIARAAADWGTRAQRALRSEWKCLEAQHRERARLDACSKRDRWKAADVPRLLDIGMTAADQERLAHILRLGRPGRPVVRNFIPWRTSVSESLKVMQGLFDPKADPRQRLPILKRTPLWPLVVEAVYRGELAAAQGARRQEGAATDSPYKPSQIAERKIGKAMVLSVPVVRALCDEARKRQAAGAEAIGEPMTLAELQHWMDTGEPPGDGLPESP